MLLRLSPFLLRDVRFISNDARFVEKMRLLEYWGIQDSALLNDFRRSVFLLMVDWKPLVKKDRKAISLAFYNHSGRFCEDSSERGISTRVRCCLPFHVPLLGTSLRVVEPSEDSPVHKEDVLDELARCFDGRFLQLRMAMLGIENERERNLLAKFQTLSRWSRVYRRCPKCGSPLRMRVSKWAASCVSCPRVYYPTLYPVTITLVSDPTDSYVLLVRHKGSAGGVYTAIAGFAHAGESLNECVRREVAEEVGVLVSKVVSLNQSQPWPMPESSLMCAHYAVADMSMKIAICPSELEAARWFSREEVAVALQRTLNDPYLKGLPNDVNYRQELMYIPPHGAIAHHMIKSWVNRDLQKFALSR